MKIPNYLTIGRIIIVPLFVFTYYLPGFYGDIIPFGLFVMKKNKEPDLVVKALENKFDQIYIE